MINAIITKFPTVRIKHCAMLRIHPIFCQAAYAQMTRKVLYPQCNIHIYEAYRTDAVSKLSVREDIIEGENYAVQSM